MPLMAQDIPKPFVGGLDEGTEPKLLEDGFTTVENGQYDKQGRISKRPGVSAQVSAGIGSEVPNRAAVYNDQLVTTTDAAAFYAARSIDTRWLLQDQIPEATIKRLGIRREIDQSMSSVDMAISGDYTVYVWIRFDDADCYYRIVETLTGTVVLEGVANSTPTSVSAPRVTTNGTKVLLTYVDGPNNDLYARRIDCATHPPTVGSETALVTTLNANTYYDTCAMGTGWALFFENTTPVGVLREVVSANPPTLGWNVTLATDAIWVSCKEVGANVYIAYMVPAGDMTYRVFDSAAGGSVLAATALEVAPASAGPTSIAALTTTSALITWKSAADLIKWRTGSTVGTMGVARSTYRVAAESKLFTVTLAGSVLVYQWVLTGASPAEIFVLVNLGYQDSDTENMRPVATTAFGGIGAAGQRIHLANAASFSSTDIRVAVRVSTVSGSTLLGGDEVRANFDDRRRHQMVRYGTALYISGGILCQWDGKQATENAYIQSPKITTTASSAAGGSLANGAYQLVAVYEEYDDNGDVHRSIASPIKEHTLGGGDTRIVLTVEPLTLTMRQDNAQQQPKVEVAVYVTEPNLDVFYRLSALGAAQANTYNQTTAYTINVDSVTTSNPTLYTTGGILENDAVYGGATILAEHKGRLWAAGGEDSEVLWYSQPRVDGEPAEFNIAQTLRVSGHKITALASLDDVLVVFTETAIFAVHGEGPNSLGDISSGSFSDPIPLPVDTGARMTGAGENHAIALCPSGIVFPSYKGICLLDRSRSMQFLGLPVEDTAGAFVSSFPVIRAVTVFPQDEQVRFTVANSAGAASASRTVVWDYGHNKWAVWKQLEGTPLRSAVLKDGVPYIIATNENAYADNGSFLDAGAWFGVTIETGWMSFGQAFAFKRLRRLGVQMNRYSTAGLAVSIATDGGSYVTRSFTESEISALDQDALRVHVSKQKGNRYRVKLAETAPAAAGRGLGYVGLIFSVGSKGREQRVEATASK